jgi:DNA-binding winged helix-turn-helix (wHTH) protein
MFDENSYVRNINSMTKFILEDKVIYDSVNHSLFHIDQRDTQVTLAIPASLCLLTMLQKKNETVSLDELLNFAWTSRGMNVSSNAIYQNISLLRKSLSKFGLSNDFIKTVPKRGFVILEDKFSVFENNQKQENSGVEEKENKSAIRTKIDNIYGTDTRSTMILQSCIFILIMVVTCLFSFYLSFQLSNIKEIKNSPYIYPDFTEIQSIGDCYIFRNKSRVSDLFFTGFISEHMLKCENQKWWYIINYPPATQTFILRCDSDIFTKKNENSILCKSDYYY